MKLIQIFLVIDEYYVKPFAVAVEQFLIFFFFSFLREIDSLLLRFYLLTPAALAAI